MSQVQSKNPSILVAMPQLQDPNFRHAVVIVIEHTAAGAIGFLINRRSNIQLRGLVSGLDFEIPDGIPVWNGGPVLSTTGVILHGDAPLASDSTIIPGVSLSSDPALIRKYVEHFRAPQTNQDCIFPYRFLVGYAGWAPGQLDAEIRTGSWIQASIDREIIFNVPEDKIWAACLRGVGITDANSVAIGRNRYLN